MFKNKKIEMICCVYKVLMLYRDHLNMYIWYLKGIYMCIYIYMQPIIRTKQYTCMNTIFNIVKIKIILK